MFKNIISLIFLITAGVVFFTWAQPYYKEIKDLKAQKNLYNEALLNTREIKEKRDDLLKEYNSISKDNLNKLNRILPSQTTAVNFIMEMDNILNKSGMVLKNIDIKEKEKEDKSKKTGTVSFENKNIFDSMNFSVKVGGSYRSFYLFLNNLENNLRPVNINSLSFSSSDTDFYEFNIEGSTYWKKQSYGK